MFFIRYYALIKKKHLQDEGSDRGFHLYMQPVLACVTCSGWLLYVTPETVCQPFELLGLHCEGSFLLDEKSLLRCVFWKTGEK